MHSLVGKTKLIYSWGKSPRSLGSNSAKIHLYVLKSIYGGNRDLEIFP